MAAVPRVRPVPFWFLRHGETDWNAQGLSQGHTDIPLNAVGLAQAERAARTLEGLGIASVVSSPLSRAVARAISAAMRFRRPRPSATRSSSTSMAT